MLTPTMLKLLNYVKEELSVEMVQMTLEGKGSVRKDFIVLRTLLNRFLLTQAIMPKEHLTLSNKAVLLVPIKTNLNKRHVIPAQ